MHHQHETLQNKRQHKKKYTLQNFTSITNIKICMHNTKISSQHSKININTYRNEFLIRPRQLHELEIQSKFSFLILSVYLQY